MEQATQLKVDADLAHADISTQAASNGFPEDQAAYVADEARERQSANKPLARKLKRWEIVGLRRLGKSRSNRARTTSSHDRELSVGGYP